VYFAAAIVLVALALYIIHLANNLEIARSRANSNDEKGVLRKTVRQVDGSAERTE